MHKRHKYSLNIRRSREKWYVSLRGASLSIVKGFSGSREELAQYLKDHSEEIDDFVLRHDRRFAESQSFARKDGAADVMASAAKRARAKGIEFTLTMEWLLAQLERIGDQCEVSGVPFNYSREKTVWHKRPDCPSLDRIDRSKGYVDGNVRIVCTAVNIAINEWGEKRFYKMCENVLRTRKTAVQNRRISVVSSRLQKPTKHNKKPKNANNINMLQTKQKGF